MGPDSSEAKPSGWTLNYLSLTLILLWLAWVICFGWVGLNRRDPDFPYKISPGFLELRYIAAFPIEAMNVILPGVPPNDISFIRGEQHRSRDGTIYRALSYFKSDHRLKINPLFRRVRPDAFYWNAVYKQDVCPEIVPFSFETLSLFRLAYGLKDNNGKMTSYDAYIAVEDTKHLYCVFYQYQAY